MFRIVTGGILLVAGLGIIVLALIGYWVFIIHGGVLAAIGLAILLNTHEDEIEEINDKQS